MEKCTARARKARWLGAFVRPALARAALVGADDDTVALIPVYMPGKKYGIWEFTSEITSVPDAVVLMNNGAGATGSERFEAELAAAKAMGETPGTVGYGVVWHRDTEAAKVAVFESIMPPIDILKAAEG